MAGNTMQAFAPLSLAPVRCETCGGPARMIEVEIVDGATPQEIWTYECASCGHVMTRTVSR